MNDAEVAEIRTELGHLDRAELEELALKAALFHARSCEAATEGNHRSESEIRQTVREKSTEALIDLLVPLSALLRSLR